MPIHFRRDRHHAKDWEADRVLELPEEDDALWELIGVYLDGEATAEEAAQVEAMLHASPAYARQFAFLQLTSETARALPEIEPPVSLTDSILAATTRRPTPARRLAAAWADLRPAFTRYAVPAGALAVTGLAAFVLWPRSSAVPPPIPSPEDQQVARNAKPLAPDKEPLPLPEIGKSPVTAAGTTKSATEPVVEKSAPGSATHLKPIKLAALPKGGASPETSFSKKPISEPKRAVESKRMGDKGNETRPVKADTPPKTTPRETSSSQVSVASNYSIQPNMDAINQRARMRDSSMLEPVNTVDVRTDGGAGNTGTEAGSDSAAATNPNGVETPPAVTNVTPRFRGARLNRAQPPPDPRRILTGSEIRKQREVVLPNADFQPLQKSEHEGAVLVGRF